MENLQKTKNMFRKQNRRRTGRGCHNQRRSNDLTCIMENSLTRANINTEYTIRSIETENSDVQDFLFTLGCYEGEVITVISILANHYVVVVKDARYSIDRDLAECIII